MKISDNCVKICAYYEGFKPKPYLCQAGVATIGYGTTRYPNGKKVTLRDAPMTEKVAREIMVMTLNDFAAQITPIITAPVNQDQFDALTDFAYNLGPDIDADDIPEGLGDSHLLKLINDGIITKDSNWKKILTAEFVKWDHVGSKINPGLLARRSTEAFLFTYGSIQFFNIKK